MREYKERRRRVYGDEEMGGDEKSREEGGDEEMRR